ncbi:GntR family transcriptional regulator [Jiella sp. MQZ9-1]|uniref:GntR family transcriptional regulator n=1 Tax=Jiella flava TaxID=2816857 RepID=A0A939FZ55_9HYPH|nr:GntR family transcriptional regulator [Jiella flava]MBO0662891.1 GntR family transcriptional regulator [Jiella flava]MCD2471349.1 GntR family transcriptional regulator [Jiella flava]
MDTRNLISQRPEPRYVTIERALSRAIASGALPAGTVLTEGPIADLFGTSRTPVRTALNDLMAKGSLARFEGRGFVVQGGEPARVPLTPAMLGIGDGEPAKPHPVAAHLIARDFEDTLAQALPFGSWRINEQAAAEHFAVSRTVVRELLSRFQDRGLVRKDLRSHWMIGPLTARDINHYFAVRRKLEPLALTDSAPLTSMDAIDAMRQRLQTALTTPHSLAPDRLAEIEHDLHVRLLSRSPNPHLLRMIGQSQMALVVNRVFAKAVGSRPFELALREHAIVYEFLIRRAWSAAAAALDEHLHLSAERTCKRLMAISVFPMPDLPRYLKQSA